MRFPRMLAVALIAFLLTWATLSPRGASPAAEEAATAELPADRQILQAAVERMLQEPEPAAALRGGDVNAQREFLREWSTAIAELRDQRNLTPAKDFAELDRASLNLLAFRYESVRRAPLEPRAWERLEGNSNERFRMDSDLNAIVKNEWERFVSPRAAAEAIVLHRETLRLLFQRRLELAAKEPDGFSRFSARLGEILRILMHYANGEGPRRAELDELAAELGQKWLTEFEKRPADKQLWKDAEVALRHLTVETREMSFKALDPLWVRLEQHRHPLLLLFGQRARAQHRWLESLAPEVRVARFNRFMDSVLPVLDAERKASRRQHAFLLEELVSMFANNTRYPQVPELATAHMDFAEGRGKSYLHSVALTQLLNPWDEDSARRALKIMKRVDPDLKTEDFHEKAEEILRAYPKLRDPALSTRAPQRKVLFDAMSENKLDMLRFVHVRGKFAYGAWLRDPFGAPSAQLIRIDLETREVARLGEHAVSGRIGSIHVLLNEAVTASHLNADAYYLAGQGLGVVRFPLDGKAPSAVIPPEQLSSLPRSLLTVGDHLYVGTNRGELVRHNLTRGERDEIGLAGPVPDADRPQRLEFSVDHVLHDARRDRLLIITIARRSEDAGWNMVQSYGLKSRVSERLFRFGLVQRRMVDARMSGDELLLSDCWLLRWNLKTDAKNLVANYTCGDLKPQRTAWLGGVATPVVCQGKIWWPDGSDLREMAPDSDRAERHYATEEERRVTDSSDSPYLVPIDDKRFLMYERQRLLEVTPKEAAPKVP